MLGLIGRTSRMAAPNVPRFANTSALSFNGSTDRVTTGSAIGISGSQNRTISLWFKAARGNVTQDIISWGNASGGGKWVIIRLVANQNRISFDTNTYSRTFNATYNDGEWHHLVMALDGTNVADVNAYMDSVSLTQQAVSDGAIDTVDTALYVGSNFVPGAYFQGQIDQVRIWNRALTATEIKAEYLGHRHPTSLVGEWLFDSPTGYKYADTSGNGNHGTATAITEQSDVGYSGNSNAISANFNGSSSKIDFGNPSELQLTTAMTVTAWIKPASVSGGYGIVSKLVTGTWNGWQLWQNNGDVRMFINNSNASTSGGLTAGQWSFVAGIWNGTNIYAFCDGTLSSGAAKATLTDSGIAGLIGARADGAQFFGGNIDQVRVFNKALSEAELNALRNSGTVPSNLVAEWTIDDKAEGTADDSSSSENDGTITGAIYTTSGLPGRSVT